MKNLLTFPWSKSCANLKKPNGSIVKEVLQNSANLKYDTKANIEINNYNVLSNFFIENFILFVTVYNQKFYNCFTQDTLNIKKVLTKAFSSLYVRCGLLVPAPNSSHWRTIYLSLSWDYTQHAQTVQHK